MKHRILHESASLVLEYDVVADYLHAIWARDQSTTSLAEGYEQILEYLGREFCHQLLDNHTAIHGYWADLAEWFCQDWYPRARQAGLQNHAVVYSTDYLGRRSNEEVLLGIGSGAVAGFVDLASAQRELLH